MNNQGKMAPHEALEIRSLMGSEVNCAKKTQAFMGMVQDQELKSFMQNSLDAKKRAIEEMQRTISGMNI